MINVNEGVITGAASFKSLHDIPSRPLPLLKFNDCIILYIQCIITIDFMCELVFKYEMRE